MTPVTIMLTDKQLKKIDKFGIEFGGRLGFIAFLIKSGLAGHEDVERRLASKPRMTKEQLQQMKEDSERLRNMTWCETFADVYETYQRCCL